jgi:hypothetical protein
MRDFGQLIFHCKQNAKGRKSLSPAESQAWGFLLAANCMIRPNKIIVVLAVPAEPSVHPATYITLRFSESKYSAAKPVPGSGSVGNSRV